MLNSYGHNRSYSDSSAPLAALAAAGASTVSPNYFDVGLVVPGGLALELLFKLIIGSMRLSTAMTTPIITTAIIVVGHAALAGIQMAFLHMLLMLPTHHFCLPIVMKIAPATYLL